MISGESERLRLISGVIAILLAIVLQFKGGDILGWKPDIVFASLITLSFFFGFLELLAVSFFAIILLAWQPTLSFEIFALVVFPIALFFFRKMILPLEGWLAAFVAAFAGIIAYYAIFDIKFALNEFNVLLLDAVINALYALLLFVSFSLFHRETEHDTTK